jgi:hypothetical protein
MDVCHDVFALPCAEIAEKRLAEDPYHACHHYSHYMAP